jgi:hypothetical protein
MWWCGDCGVVACFVKTKVEVEGRYSIEYSIQRKACSIHGSEMNIASSSCYHKSDPVPDSKIQTSNKQKDWSNRGQ